MVARLSLARAAALALPWLVTACPPAAPSVEQRPAVTIRAERKDTMPQNDGWSAESLGLSARLRTDKPRYRYGEPVMLILEVWNLSATGIALVLEDPFQNVDHRAPLYGVSRLFVRHTSPGRPSAPTEGVYVPVPSSMFWMGSVATVAPRQTREARSNLAAGFWSTDGTANDPVLLRLARGRYEIGAALAASGFAALEARPGGPTLWAGSLRIPPVAFLIE